MSVSIDQILNTIKAASAKKSNGKFKKISQNDFLIPIYKYSFLFYLKFKGIINILYVFKSVIYTNQFKQVFLAIIIK